MTTCKIDIEIPDPKNNSFPMMTDKKMRIPPNAVLFVDSYTMVPRSKLSRISVVYLL